MHLEFNQITQYQSVKTRIKNNGYSRYGMNQDDVSGLRVQMFTLEKIAKEQSQINLEQIFQKAKLYKIPTVIVKPQTIQFVGHATYIRASSIANDDEIAHFKDDTISRWANGPRWRDEMSRKGYYLLELGGYFSQFWALNEQCGYYQINHLGTDFIKITNRRTQIQQLWDWGWPARRGRPVTVGHERHSGNCQEIECLTEMAAQMWSRQRESEVAKRACSNFRSINKEYAWPGNW